MAAKETGMKLYKVSYKVWNRSFSDLLQREALSIGTDGEDAIRRVKARVDKDARNFEVQEIKEISGHRIRVD